VEVSLAPDGSPTVSRSIIQLAASGDRDAFAQVVAAHDASMFRLSVVITGDAELARDAVQQAWIRAWPRLRSLRDEARLRSWLLSIAANEARGIMRTRAASGRREQAFVEGSGIAPRSHESLLDLERELARLAPDERAVLALRYLLGFNAKEIGDLLHLSHGAVRSRLARLIERLREVLRDD
jgi:RNA polymerase sigma-70 factor (ECF subfamily)